MIGANRLDPDPLELSPNALDGLDSEGRQVHLLPVADLLPVSRGKLRGGFGKPRLMVAGLSGLEAVFASVVARVGRRFLRLEL